MPGSAVVDVRDTFGEAFLGFLISTALFGLTVGQTWIYYWHYGTKDTKALKFFVAFITVLDTAVTIVTAYAMCWYLVLNFDNVEALEGTSWLLSLQANISAVAGTAVQMFYARRIHLVSQDIFLPIVIVALCVVGNVTGLYITVTQLSTQVNSRYHSLLVFGYVSMSNIILVDVLIASSMCWALYRKKTGLARTDSMIMTLMAYTLNAGLLSTVLGIAMTVSFVLSPNSMIPEAIFWPLCKCYINSMLAMLNSRDYIRDRSSPDNSDNSFNLFSIQFEPPGEACQSIPA